MATRTARDMWRAWAVGWLGMAGVTMTNGALFGRIWVAVPIMTALLPAFVRRLQPMDRPVGQDHRPLVGRP